MNGPVTVDNVIHHDPVFTFTFCSAPAKGDSEWWEKYRVRGHHNAIWYGVGLCTVGYSHGGWHLFFCDQAFPLLMWVWVKTLKQSGNYRYRLLEHRSVFLSVTWSQSRQQQLSCIHSLNTGLNPICHLLALIGAHHIFHVSRMRVQRFVCNLDAPTKYLNKVKTNVLFSPRRADHSSRGVLLRVYRVWVWSRRLDNEEALAHWGLLCY